MTSKCVLKSLELLQDDTVRVREGKSIPGGSQWAQDSLGATWETSATTRSRSGAPLRFCRSECGVN